ncbi:hypothetical protein AJ87_20025 [Rhizobium yanglingense]|nr:hypothetical protein AJ87_20025 [Rhizobium yanglingense]
MRLFPRYREALARTMEIVRLCKFSLEELTYQYPEEAVVPGKAPRPLSSIMSGNAFPTAIRKACRLTF